MKRNLRSTLLAVAVGAGMMLAAGTANATLIGDTVTAEILFGGVTAQGPANAVVGPGVEFIFGNASIDVGASGADYFMIVTGTVVRDETYRLTDLDWVDIPGEIVGVIINSFGGLSNAPVIAFGLHSVDVTLPGGTFVDAGAFIRASFETRHIPEPATLTLLGMGLVGLGFMMRRRRKTV